MFDHDSPATAEEIHIHNYLHVFAVSFLFYDHLLTSRREIDYLWKKRKTRSSIWFFANRYFAFFTNIAVTVLGFSNLEASSCRRYNLSRQLILIINQVLVCILLTLRIYAIYERSLRILCYMVGSGAVLVGISSWALFGQKNAPSQIGSGCHIGLSQETAYRLAGAWESLFVYDTIIFGLTIFKSWRTSRDRAITGIDIPLISLILRDGAIYFAVMALCNLANILTFYFCGPFLRGGLSTFASCISSTMIARLMLNLHRTAEIGIFSTPHTTTNRTSLDYGTGLDIVSPSNGAYGMEETGSRPRPR